MQTFFIVLLLNLRWITLLQSVSSPICIKINSANNNKSILENELNDKYEIMEGNLVWVHTNTKWGNNPSGVSGAYMYDDDTPEIVFHSHDAVIFSGCS